MSCGTIIIPPMDRPSDSSGGVYRLFGSNSDDIQDWSWVPVEVPQYNPPIIDNINLSSEPPAVPAIPFASVDLPYRAPDSSITPPQFGPVPVLDATKPSIYEPTQPDDLTAKKPGDAPEISDVTVPDAPVVDVPAAPGISDPVMPEAIEVQLPVFDGKIPDGSNINAPDNTFNFTEEEYNSAVLDKTTEEILRMLNGGVGIPYSTWTLMLQQGIEREEQSGNKLMEEVTMDWASRGWDEPGGNFSKRMREAQQEIYTARNTLSRENTIEQAKMELENLKYAISQGLAREQILINLHNSAQDRGLKAAELGVTIAIQLMEAKISLYNSELQAYQTSANVFKTLVDAEMTKVEVYKAEIEAAGLGVEVDKARVDAYTAQIRGLSMVVELHNSQVRTVLAQVEIETARIEAYKTRVQSYAEEVKAWATEWDGYKSAWSGQTAKVDAYKSAVDAYASEVSGYASKAKVEEIKVDAEKSSITLDIERMKSDTSRYAAEVGYQAERSASIARSYASQMEGYKTKAVFEGNKIDVYKAKLQADITNAQMTSTSAQANAQLVAAQLEAIQRLNLSAYETEAKIESQKEASKLGQFNTSTSLSSSFGTSYSYDCTA